MMDHVGELDTGQEILLDLARRAGLQPTRAQLATAASFFNGDYAGNPHRLAELFQAGGLDEVTLVLLLPIVWRSKLDACALPADTWREMFLAVPYTVNGCPVALPRWPRRLYRGATHANREGLSWTTNLAIAAYFASTRQVPGMPGQVWTVTAPPHRLLAHIGDENEYVVDARNLTVRAIDPGTWPQRLLARMPSLRPPATHRASRSSPTRNR